MSLIPFSPVNRKVRVVKDYNGEPWFNAADVCQLVEAKDVRKALKANVDLDDVRKFKTLTSDGSYLEDYVNSAGLYSLVASCCKDMLKLIKPWLSSSVAPALDLMKVASSKPDVPAGAEPTETMRELVETLNRAIETQTMLLAVIKQQLEEYPY